MHRSSFFFEAEKQKKKDSLDDLKNQVPGSVGQSGKKKTDNGQVDFMIEVDRHQKEHKCSRTDALKAVVKEMPALYEAYCEGGSE